MTVLIALLARDGAVLGADQALSHAEGRLAETFTPKLWPSGDGLGCFAFAGAFPGAQTAFEVLSARVKRGADAATQTRHGLVTEVQGALLCAPNPLLNGLAALKQPISADSLVALSGAVVSQGFWMQGVGSGASSVPAVVSFGNGYDALHLDEMFPFHTRGSGSTMALPYMEILRRKFFREALPSLDDAVLAVYWTLRHVLEARAGGGVGGEPHLAVLAPSEGQTWKAEVATTRDHPLLEQAVRDYDELEAGIADAFRRCRLNSTPGAAGAAVPIPPPAVTAVPPGVPGQLP